MAPAIKEAIRVWNELEPATENCSFCEVWEEPPNPDFVNAPHTMADTIIHEMGHCIFGLDHTNSDLGGPNSFTNTANVSIFEVGIDGIRGSADDQISFLPEADIVHWFRKQDNNPFVLDGVPVDISNYSRLIIDIMDLGDSWAANANIRVGEALGIMNTQAVMYSGGGPGQRFSALAPDDFHTVAFGMSGFDEEAGTSDDYSVHVIFDGTDCSNADVQIELTIPMVNPDSLGLCLSDIAPLPGRGIFNIHHVITEFMSMPITVQVNPAYLWDVVFSDGFESGDFTAWK